MKKIILNIEGMTCSACSNGLEKYLKKQQGIKDAVVNLVMATAMVECEENISIEDLNKFVEEAGFKSLGEKIDKKESKDKKILIFSILAIILMYISMGNMLNAPIPEIIDISSNPIIYGIILLILTIPFLFFGFDIIKNGLKNIINKMPNMDSLVGIGVCVNFIYSLVNLYLVLEGKTQLIHNLYFESSAIIILFVKIGRKIDKNNKDKAIENIKNLVEITPKNATKIIDGKEEIVTIDEIRKGDILICKPGEKIAVDGVIIKGQTHTDEAFITGESKPVEKRIGSSVIAGSINYDGYIEYKAEKIGKDSSISNIVQMVVEATNTKAPISRLADKISGYFVPTIFIIAIFSFFINLIFSKQIVLAINSFVSVLVVACPCALGLATPLAMVVSIGATSKKGILIKSSSILEELSKIKIVIFDKTGTLTKGEMSITDSNCSKENLKILQSLETLSNHPLAKGICKNMDEVYEVQKFEEVPGLGIKGIINEKLYYAGNNKFIGNLENPYKDLEQQYTSKEESIVYLFSDEKVLAIIGLSDEIKPNMNEVIEKLKKDNKEIIMLTGDNADTANMIAKNLNIDKVISNVTPKEKLEKVNELCKLDNCLMVGDGINDSPALKAATIGVSVANGTDISADSADILLLNEKMELICDLFKIGNKTIKIVKENLFWALFYNMCMIPLATGLLPITLNPMIASFAMTLSSITVVLNSLRLKK